MKMEEIIANSKKNISTKSRSKKLTSCQPPKPTTTTTTVLPSTDLSQKVSEQ